MLDRRLAKWQTRWLVRRARELFWISLAAVLVTSAADAQAEYGDILMQSFVEKRDSLAVLFPHAKHRGQYRCNVCHGDLGFAMRAGANRIDMGQIARGHYCGACHNGKISWATEQCVRCHVKQAPTKTTKPVTVKPVGQVNWVALLHGGEIKPRANLEDTVEYVQFDRDIVMASDGHSLNAVLFSHKIHTEWLSCTNCHPAIFETRRGANPISMAEMIRGQSCGVCHRKVAFPLAQCKRCHALARTGE